MRSAFTELSDERLLAQCAVDTYRASGPGGQKRNKTSSAVRLRHEPTGILVIAEESRSQHENKAKALRRVRQALYLHLREQVDAAAVAEHPEFAPARDREGRLHLSAKDARFWPAAGIVLDALAAAEGQVSTAAEWLGTSTGNLVDFLQVNEKVWQAANQLRQAFGFKVLKSNS
jgi:hypothetical protein